MKKITIIITAILLVLNLLMGLLLSAFKPFNVGFTSLAILIAGVLIYLIQIVKIKEALAISLSFVYAVVGIITYVLGVFSPSRIEDNGFVVTTLVLWVIETVILLLLNWVSKTIE